MELMKQGIAPLIEEYRANQIKLEKIEKANQIKLEKIEKANKMKQEKIEKERISLLNFKSLTKTIDKDHKKHYSYLVSLLNLNSIEQLANTLHLLYRGSEHNFDTSKFHQVCDGKGKTLVLIRSESKSLFGGYSTVSWHSNGSGSSAQGSFLFSLDKETKHIIIRNEGNAIRGYKDYGPTFGSGLDLFLSNNCNANNNSLTNLGGTYSLPPNIIYNTNESKSYLTGSNYFSVEEYEVFFVD